MNYNQIRPENHFLTEKNQIFEIFDDEIFSYFRVPAQCVSLPRLIGIVRSSSWATLAPANQLKSFFKCITKKLKISSYLIEDKLCYNSLI